MKVALTVGLASVPACARCGAEAPARAAPPGVSVRLACKTTRFGWVPTATGSAPRPDPSDHHHGSGELVLPLVLGRSRCPARGQLLVRVTTPPSSAPRAVEVAALGSKLTERVRAGPDVLLAGSIPLAGWPPGRHPVEVHVDGAAVPVPDIDVIP